MTTPLSSTHRRRGVILTNSGFQKLQDAHVTYDHFGYRQTIEYLGELSRLSRRTVVRILSGTEAVDQRTLKQFFQSFKLQLEPDDYTYPELSAPATPSTPPITHQDLQEAIAISAFYGRQQELSTLEQWIVQERCRLVAILGSRGIGKSTLSVKLIEQIQGQFEFVVWKTLRNGPPLSKLLEELISFLSQQQETCLPEQVGSRLSTLLKYLHQHRCLLVLDNVETLFVSKKRPGVYQPGYEAYGELFQQAAEIAHQSCLVLTSGEKPKEVKRLEGYSVAVRCLELSGLSLDAGRALVEPRGRFSGSEADWQGLIEYYGGNPVALQIVTPLVLDYLHGDLTKFVAQLQQGQLVFADIYDLLEPQFHRLTELEQQVMEWSAVERECVSLDTLQSHLVPVVLLGKLWDALDGLQRRSLIEKNGTQFTLIPAVMDCLTEWLVEQVSEEIVNQTPKHLKRVALLLVQGKEYLQQLQRRLILIPSVEQLLAKLGSAKAIEQRLREMLVELREHHSANQGYAIGNILNLLIHLGVELREYDFSQMQVWQADLRRAICLVSISSHRT